MQTIRIQIEAHAPEELPVPTVELRWFVAGDYCGIPLVQIEGERDKVVQFVSDHWGLDTITGGDVYGFSWDDPDVATAVNEFLERSAVNESGTRR